jgi:hypothetical protein
MYGDYNGRIHFYEISENLVTRKFSHDVGTRGDSGFQHITAIGTLAPNLVATGHESGCMVLWHVEGETLRNVMEFPTDGVFDITPISNSHVCWRDSQNSIPIYNFRNFHSLEQPQYVKTITRKDDVNVCEFLPGEKKILLGTSYGEVVLVDSENFKELSSWQISSVYEGSCLLGLAKISENYLAVQSQEFVEFFNISEG